MAFIEAINNPITREIQKDYNRAIAQKIRNRLHQLENANDKDKRRWIWELLQNASDTVHDRTVDIEIIITENYIEFKHNGGYFSPRNITNLVHQISSKEGEDSIGRFGTGFLTTHTLSRTVEVEGIFTENEDYYDFKVRLNRTGNTEVELVKGIEETWDTFKTDKLKEKPQNIVWSSFKYLNQNKAIATETINDFITLIHYNLAFVSSIGKVKVIDRINNYHFSISEKYTQKVDNFDFLFVLTFEVNENDNIFEKTLLLADNSEIQAAVEVDNSNNKIIPIPNNIPRLFCAFPLIGTENFTFPMILNSRNFAPKTERDGLYLKGETSETKVNKPLLLQAVELYTTALEYLVNQKVDDLFLLAQHRNHFKDDYFDEIWYQNTIEKAIQKELFTTAIVKNIHGSLITIQNTQFPFYIKNEKLDKDVINKTWEFQSVLSPNQTPQKSDIFEWNEIIWDDCTTIDLKSIASKLQSLGNIQSLQNHINNVDINTLHWLDDLISFYIKNERLLLDDFKFIPNQKGIFCSKDDLNFDNNIPEVLKDVYKILGEDWRDKLLHLELKSPISLLKPLHVSNIITGINAKIEHQKASYESIKKATFKLITILPTVNEGNYPYRKSLYDFSKDLFKNEIAEVTEIKSLPTNLWKEANTWQIRHIASVVKAQGTIDKLTNFLQKENSKEGLDWLNTFFDFLITKNGNLGRNIIEEYTIIPNQKNIFRKKEDIYLDNNIHNELKDIYLIFEEDWYERLLSLEMTALFNLFEKEKKVQLPIRIIQGINSKIENKKANEEQIKEAVFALTRLLPTEIQETEQENYKIYRNTIYDFSKDLFKNEIPNSLELEDLPRQTWKNSDEWLFDYMVNTIEEQENITNFNKLLDYSNNDEVLSWLNNLFLFFIKNNKTRYFTGKIYPNQLGDFKLKSSLFRDDNIADAFKDILHDLDNALSVEGKKGWRHLLLDKNITAFKEIPQKTTKDISDEINKKIPNLKTHPSNALQKTLFKLVTLIQSENQHQRKLWEYLRTFYLDEVPKQLQIVENAENFDWQPCFLWCVERLIKDITTLKYVDELEEELHGNVKILDWLADFIEFLHETEAYKKLLDGEEYAIIPNQNGSFQIKSRLYADIEIDEDLKKIIKLLNPAWLDDLLENSPIFVDLPKDKERTIIDAALEVDRIFRTYSDDAQKSEYVESIRIISDWMYNGDEAFNKQYLDYVHNKEAELVVSTLGSRKKKDEVLQIIQSGKAPILSKIANDNNFSEDELETLNSNPEMVKELIYSLKNKQQKTTDVKTDIEINKVIKNSTGFNNLEELLINYEQNQKNENLAAPKFKFVKANPSSINNKNAAYEANEEAQNIIREHLKTNQNYDVDIWNEETKTIIRGVKKHGLNITLVTKSAKNNIIFLYDYEINVLAEEQYFSELWIYDNEKIHHITLGEILKVWNIEAIKTNMFDLK